MHTSHTTDKAFTISAYFTITVCLIAAGGSVVLSEWEALVWQLMTALGFTAALMQSGRANRAEAGR